MRYPNLFLAGAPKCGTTSLAYYLGQHSDVFSPLVKEPNFFGSDLTASGKRLPRETYSEFYDKWTKERFALDASTQNFYSKNAASEIAAKSPDAFIVTMVRNPIDATYSMFHQMRFNGTETMEVFEDSLEAEKERTQNPIAPKFGFLENLFYSRVYSFTENIQRFEQIFGQDRVHTIVLDDLKQNPASTMMQTCNFLGLDSDEISGFDFETKNTAKRVKYRWLNTLANYPPAWAGFLTKPLFSRDMRIRIRKFIGEKNTQATVNPPMEPSTRVRLSEHFKPEIEKLSRHLDRDLSFWLENDV